MSETKQGVTLEIFGESWSMGPLNPTMKAQELKEQGDIKYPIEWNTLGEYLEYLERRGVTPNVASFVGATTVRMHELGEANRAPTAEELARMQELVRAAMGEGALGVGASLIYAPAFYAKPDELVALSQAAAESDGGYVAHMRSEANQFLEALDETIAIARATGQRAEAYHLKAGGQRNWPKMAQAIASHSRASPSAQRAPGDAHGEPCQRSIRRFIALAPGRGRHGAGCDGDRTRCGAGATAVRPSFSRVSPGAGYVPASHCRRLSFSAGCWPSMCAGADQLPPPPRKMEVFSMPQDWSRVKRWLVLYWRFRLR